MRRVRIPSYAYGGLRSTSGTLTSDRTLRWTQGIAFTGQKQDGTGLPLTAP